MFLDLECKNCGFHFKVDIPDDTTEEDIKDIKTCPCGCLMTDLNEGDEE